MKRLERMHISEIYLVNFVYGISKFFVLFDGQQSTPDRFQRFLHVLPTDNIKSFSPFLCFIAVPQPAPSYHSIKFVCSCVLTQSSRTKRRLKRNQVSTCTTEQETCEFCFCSNIDPHDAVNCFSFQDLCDGDDDDSDSGSVGEGNSTFE